MTKILIAALSISVLGFLAYRTLYGHTAPVDREAPAQQLQNVREAAKGMEEKGAERAADIEQKMEQ